jgi:hypothetical protein
MVSRINPPIRKKRKAGIFFFLDRADPLALADLRARFGRDLCQAAASRLVPFSDRLDP